VIKHSDNWFEDHQAHDFVPTFTGGLYELVWQICKTWVERANDYDNNQWTMLELLMESFIVYMFLVATAYIKPRYRMVAALLMMWYELACRDAVFRLLGFFGVFIAEIQIQHSTAPFLEAHRLACQLIALALGPFGLYLCSYPEGHYEWVQWAKDIHDIEEKIIPAHSDFPRFSTSFGLMFIVFAIILAPRLQKMLSNYYLLWLGRHSFAVYLLHMQIFKTVWAWLLYGIHIPPDHLNDKGEPEMTRLQFPSLTWFWATLPPVLLLVYVCAYYWALYVDRYCERLVYKLMEFIKLDTTKEQTSYLPLRPVP
jgi:hypothetical protein